MIKGLEKCKITYEENLQIYQQEISDVVDGLKKDRYYTLSKIGSDYTTTCDYYFYCAEDIKGTCQLQ